MENAFTKRDGYILNDFYKYPTLYTANIGSTEAARDADCAANPSCVLKFADKQTSMVEYYDRLVNPRYIRAIPSYVMYYRNTYPQNLP
jgi:hypothetical protein